jgi:DNA 3'-phosphatase
MADEYTTQEWYEHKSIVFYVPDTTDFYTDYEDFSSSDTKKSSSKNKSSSKAKTKNVVKLAGFDMDGTLINTNDGHKWATKADDFVLAYENIPDMFHKYKEEGYCLAIISNRKASPEGRSIKAAKQRVANLFEQIGFECFVFFLTGEGEYRKPGAKVLELLKYLASIDEFDEESFFCGDAAKGYPFEENQSAPWYQWSDSDYGMVQNWNRKNKDILEFYLPNQIFEEFNWEAASVNWHKNNTDIILIITCGQKGSGYPEKKEDYYFTGKYSSSKNASTRHDSSGSHNNFYIRHLSDFKKKYQWIDDGITVITGSHPTFEEREDIRKKFKVKKAETLIVWFTRSSLDGLSKAEENEYSKSFESPETTGENWIRGN